MHDLKIVKAELDVIMDCLEQYTREPPATTWMKNIRESLSNGDYDLLVYSCKELLSWYDNEQLYIQRNEYVYNKNVYIDNEKRLQNVITELTNNEAYYRKEISNNIGAHDKSYGLSDLLILLDRFHQVVVQLQNRHQDRNTVNIKDEYDVQDLLHALLRIFYDDVRAEEWVPSSAGSCKRQDFLLKDQHIVIEVKKTRTGLGSKELGDQLKIDIASYKTHPDCKVLICFVYDVDNKVTNPRGFENDLSKITDGIDVRVLVRP